MCPEPDTTVKPGILRCRHLLGRAGAVSFPVSWSVSIPKLYSGLVRESADGVLSSSRV